MNLELFREYPQRKVAVGIQRLHDITGVSRTLIGPSYRFLQIKDITDPGRHVVVNTDLEGRLMSVSMKQHILANEPKILERNFDGRFYVYLENLVNLEPGHEGVDLHADYWNEWVDRDNAKAKFLVDLVHKFLLQLSKTGFKTNGEITFTHLGPESFDRDPPKVRNLDENIISILREAQNKYGWKGLTENRLYHEAYPTPITVLPPNIRPDQSPIYAVIQIVTGCPRMRSKGKACNFCHSYLGIKYEEKTLHELEKHIKKVKQYYGRGWENIVRVFLSDGDPLNTTMIDSATYLNFIIEEIPNIEEVHSFVSTVTILSKSMGEWKMLMDHGLALVYWGVESADDDTLKLLGKHHNKEMLYKAQERLHKAELPFAPIIMSGIGALHKDRKPWQVTNNPHVTQTVKFLQRANPHTIYISKFMPVPGTPLYNMLQNGKLRALSTQELDNQHHKFSTELMYHHVEGQYGGQFI